MCSLFTATGDPRGTQILHFRPSGLILFVPQRLHVLGTVVLRVAAACASHFSVHNGTPHPVLFERTLHPQT